MFMMNLLLPENTVNAYMIRQPGFIKNQFLFAHFIPWEQQALILNFIAVEQRITTRIKRKHITDQHCRR